MDKEFEDIINKQIQKKFSNSNIPFEKFFLIKLYYIKKI